jgi:hypothetical protein
MKEIQKDKIKKIETGRKVTVEIPEKNMKQK